MMVIFVQLMLQPIKLSMNLGHSILTLINTQLIHPMAHLVVGTVSPSAVW